MADEPTPDSAARGTPARRTSGTAIGSGAGAGGSGGPEEYDSDPQGGGGDLNQPTATDRPDQRGDGAKHGSR